MRPPGPAAFGEVDRFLVPAGHRSALRYFLRRLDVAHGLGERLRWRLLRGTPASLAGTLLFRRRWRMDPATFELRPAGNGASEAGGSPWREAGPLLRAAARPAPTETGETAGALGPVPLGRTILLRDYSGSGRGQLVLFPFPRGEAEPATVVKVRTRKGAAPGTEDGPLSAEGRALRDLRARLPEELAATLPRPLGWDAPAAGTERLMLSHLPGQSAYGEMQNRLCPGRRVETHLRTAGLWLARFHEATRHPERRFRSGPEDRTKIRGLAGMTGQGEPSWYRELCELLDHDPVPLAAAHGDFWSRNLLLAETAAGSGPDLPAGVVDWEHFRTVAPPFEDLFHFAVSYGANYPWRRYRRLPLPEAFRHTFCRENRIALAVRRYARGYGRRTGSSPRLLDRLFRLYVARRADEAEDGPARRRWRACWRSLPDADHLLFGR